MNVISIILYDSEDNDKWAIRERKWECGSNTAEAFRRLKTGIREVDGSKGKAFARLNRFPWFLVPLTGRHSHSVAWPCFLCENSRHSNKITSHIGPSNPDFNLCSTFHNIASPKDNRRPLQKFDEISWICKFTGCSEQLSALQTTNLITSRAL